MNQFYLVTFLTLVGFASALKSTQGTARGGWGHNGSNSCYDYEDVYGSGCDYIRPEATCDDPCPEIDYEGGKICDLVECYCKEGYFRDLETERCVRLCECPQYRKRCGCRKHY